MSDRKGNYLLTAFIFMVFFPATAVLSSSIILLTLIRLMSPGYAWWVHRTWGKLVLYLAGVRVRVRGLENIPRDDGFLIVSNHQSAFDIPLLMGFFPRHIAFMAKHSLFKIPLMGKAMSQVGHLPVYREQSSKALGLLKSAAKSVQNGSNVVIFPEGTRGPGGADLLEFKRGGFVLARLAKRPIIPVAVVGSSDRLASKSLKPSPGPVLIDIGQPIDPAGKKPDETAAITENVIKKMLSEGEREL